MLKRFSVSVWMLLGIVSSTAWAAVAVTSATTEDLGRAAGTTARDGVLDAYLVKVSAPINIDAGSFNAVAGNLRVGGSNEFAFELVAPGGATQTFEIAFRPLTSAARTLVTGTGNRPDLTWDAGLFTYGGGTPIPALASGDIDETDGAPPVPIEVNSNYPVFDFNLKRGSPTFGKGNIAVGTVWKVKFSEVIQLVPSFPNTIDETLWVTNGRVQDLRRPDGAGGVDYNRVDSEPDTIQIVFNYSVNPTTKPNHATTGRNWGGGTYGYPPINVPKSTLNLNGTQARVQDGSGIPATANSSNLVIKGLSGLEIIGAKTMDRNGNGLIDGYRIQFGHSVASILSIAGNGVTATVTTGTPHGLASGQTVLIENTTLFNGEYVVTVTGAQTFTVASTRVGTEMTGKVSRPVGVRDDSRRSDTDPAGPNGPAYVFKVVPVVPIATIVGSGTLITVTTTKKHFLSTGQIVEIAGTVNFDGQYTATPVTVVDETTFTIRSAKVGNETVGRVTTLNTFTSVKFFDGDPDDLTAAPTGAGNGPLPNDPFGANNGNIYIVFDEDASKSPSRGEGDTDQLPELRIPSEKLRDAATLSEALPDVLTSTDIDDPGMVDQSDRDPATFAPFDVVEQDGAAPVPLTATATKPLDTSNNIQTGTEILLRFSEPIARVTGAVPSDFRIYTPAPLYNFELCSGSDGMAVPTLVAATGAVKLTFTRGTLQQRFRSASQINVDWLNNYDAVGQDGLESPGAIADAAGNDAAAIRTKVDGTTRVEGINIRGFGEIAILSVETVDLNKNGKLDYLKVTFAAPVDDTTYNFGNGWDISASNDPDAGATPPPLPIKIDHTVGPNPPIAPTIPGEVAGDNVIYIPLVENDTTLGVPGAEQPQVDPEYITRDYNTDATPTLQFVKPTDGSTSLIGIDGYSTVKEGTTTAVDKAPPVLVDVVSSRCVLDDYWASGTDNWGRMEGGQYWIARYSENIEMRPAPADWTYDAGRRRWTDWNPQFPGPNPTSNPPIDADLQFEVTTIVNRSAPLSDVTGVKITFVKGATTPNSQYTYSSLSTQLNMRVDADGLPIQDVQSDPGMTPNVAIPGTLSLLSGRGYVRGLDGIGLSTTATKTLDSDSNGFIDGVILTFTVAVDDATVGDLNSWLKIGDSYDWNTGQTTGLKTLLPFDPDDPADEDLPGQPGSHRNDNKIVVRFAESSSGQYDTYKQLAIQSKASPLRSFLDGRRLALADFREFWAQDGAGPVLAEAWTEDHDVNGKIDRVYIVFSEPVNVTDGAAGVFDAFAVTDDFYGDYTITDVPVNKNYTKTATGTTSDPFVLYLVEKTDAELAALPQPRQGDTDARPTITYYQSDGSQFGPGKATNDDRIVDGAGSEVPGRPFSGTVDKARPALLRVVSDWPLVAGGGTLDPTIQSPNRAEVYKGTTFTFYFSEPVQAGLATYKSFDWGDAIWGTPPTYSNCGGPSVTPSWGKADLGECWMKIKFNTSTANRQWDASDTVNMLFPGDPKQGRPPDPDAAIMDVAKPTPNLAAIVPKPLTIEGLDVENPSVKKISTLDSNGDGVLDGLYVEFSERINDELKIQAGPGEAGMVIWAMPKYTGGSVTVDLDGITTPTAGAGTGVIAPGTALKRFAVTDRVNWYDRNADGRWTPGVDALYVDSDGNRNYTPGIDDDPDAGVAVPGSVLTKTGGGDKHGRNSGGIIVDSADGVLRNAPPSGIANSASSPIYRLRPSIAFAYLDQNANGKYDPAGGETIYFLSSNPIDKFHGTPRYVEPPAFVDGNGRAAGTGTDPATVTPPTVVEGSKLRLPERWERFVWYDSTPGNPGVPNQKWDPGVDGLWVQKLVKSPDAPLITYTPPSSKAPRPDIMMIDSDGAFTTGDAGGSRSDVANGTALSLFKESDHVVWLTTDREWTPGDDSGQFGDSLFYDANGDLVYNKADGDLLLIRGTIAGDSDTRKGYLLNEHFGFAYADSDADGSYDPGTLGGTPGERIYATTFWDILWYKGGNSAAVVERARYRANYDNTEVLVAPAGGIPDLSWGVVLDPQLLLTLGVTIAYQDRMPGARGEYGSYTDGEPIYYFNQPPLVYPASDFAFDTLALGTSVPAAQQAKDEYGLFLFNDAARKKGVLGSGEMLVVSTWQPGLTADIQGLVMSRVKSVEKSATFPAKSDGFIAFNVTDGAAPVLVQAASMDDNSDGVCDMFRFRFSEPVDHNTYKPLSNQSNLTIANFTVLSTSAMANVTQEPNVTDQASPYYNDDTIYVALSAVTSPPNYDTGKLGDVTTGDPAQGATELISDVNGNPCGKIVSATVVEEDDAPPVLVGVTVSVELEQTSRRFLPNPADPFFTLTFSEPIQATRTTLDDFLFVNKPPGAKGPYTYDIHYEPANIMSVVVSGSTLTLRFAGGTPSDPTDQLWEVTDQFNIRDGQTAIRDVSANRNTAVQIPVADGLKIVGIDTKNPKVSAAYYFNIENIKGQAPTSPKAGDVIVVVFSERIIIKNALGRQLYPGEDTNYNGVLDPGEDTKPLPPDGTGTAGVLDPADEILAAGLGTVTALDGTNGLFEMPVTKDKLGSGTAYVGLYFGFITDPDTGQPDYATQQKVYAALNSLAKGNATNYNSITIRVGDGATFNPSGKFDGAKLGEKSPSGIEIGKEVIDFSPTANIIEDLTGLEVARNDPAGVDIQVVESQPIVAGDGLAREGKTTYILRQSGVVDALGLKIQSQGIAFIKSITVHVTSWQPLDFTKEFNPIANAPGSGISLWRDNSDPASPSKDVWAGFGGDDVRIRINESDSKVEAEAGGMGAKVTLAFDYGDAPVTGINPSDQINFWICFCTMTYDDPLSIGGAAQQGQAASVITNNKPFQISISPGNREQGEGIIFYGDEINPRPSSTEAVVGNPPQYPFRSETFHTWDSVKATANMPARVSTGEEVLPNGEPTAVLAWDVAYTRGAELSNSCISFFLPGLTAGGVNNQIKNISVWRETGGAGSFDYFCDTKIGEGWFLNPDTSEITAFVYPDTDSRLLAPSLNDLPKDPGGTPTPVGTVAPGDDPDFYVVIELNSNVSIGQTFQASVELPGSLAPYSGPGAGKPWAFTYYGCLSGATCLAKEPDQLKEQFFIVTDPIRCTLLPCEAPPDPNAQCGPPMPDLWDIPANLMGQLKEPMSVLPDSAPFAVIGIHPWSPKRWWIKRINVDLNMYEGRKMWTKDNTWDPATDLLRGADGHVANAGIQLWYGSIYNPDPKTLQFQVGLERQIPLDAAATDGSGFTQIVLQTAEQIPATMQENCERTSQGGVYFVVLRTSDKAQHCTSTGGKQPIAGDWFTAGLGDWGDATSGKPSVIYERPNLTGCPAPSVGPTVVQGSSVAAFESSVVQVTDLLHTYKYVCPNTPDRKMPTAEGNIVPVHEPIILPASSARVAVGMNLANTPTQTFIKEMVITFNAFDHYWIDDPAGTPGVYEPGIDEIWSDRSGSVRLSYDPVTNPTPRLDAAAVCLYDGATPGPQGRGGVVYNLNYNMEYNAKLDMMMGVPGTQLNPVRPWPHFTALDLRPLSDPANYEEAGVMIYKDNGNGVWDDPDRSLADTSNLQDVTVFSTTADAPVDIPISGYKWLQRSPDADHNGDGIPDIQLFVAVPYKYDDKGNITTNMMVPPHDQPPFSGYDYFIVLKSSTTIAQYDEFEVVIDEDWTEIQNIVQPDPPNPLLHNGIVFVDNYPGPHLFQYYIDANGRTANRDEEDMNSSSVLDPIFALYNPNGLPGGGQGLDSVEQSSAVTWNCIVLSQPEYKDKPGLDAAAFPTTDYPMPGAPYAVLAINLEDGYGEKETLDSVRVWFNDIGDANFEPTDLMPLTTNKQSGVALYRDSNRNGVFDPDVDEYVDIGTNQIRWFGPITNPVWKAYNPALQSVDPTKPNYSRSYYVLLKPQVGQDIPDDDKRAWQATEGLQWPEGRRDVNGYGGDGQLPLYTRIPNVGDKGGKGGADFFVVIRTSTTINYGDDFNVSVHYDLHSDSNEEDYVDEVRNNVIDGHNDTIPRPLYNPGVDVDSRVYSDVVADLLTKDINCAHWRINADIWSDVLVARVPVIYTDIPRETGKTVIQANSPPTPIVGINMWDSGDDDPAKGVTQPGPRPDEHLLSVTVQFWNLPGRTDFTNKDLREIVYDNVNNDQSGVMIYYDAPGGIDGVFEPGIDKPVKIDRSNHVPSWVASPDGTTYAVRFDLDASDPSTRIPDDDTTDGNRGPDFYVVIRTSETISNADAFRVRIWRETITSPSFSYPSPGLVYGNRIAQLYTDECPLRGTMTIHTVERRSIYQWGIDYTANDNPLDSQLPAALGLTRRALPTDRFPCNQDNNLLALNSTAVVGDVYYYEKLLNQMCLMDPFAFAGKVVYEVPSTIDTFQDNAYGTTWKQITTNPITASAVTSLDLRDYTVPNQTIEADNDPPLPVIGIDICDGPAGIETLNALTVVIDDVGRKDDLTIAQMSGDLADLTGASPKDGVSVWWDANNNGRFDPTVDTFIPSNIVLGTPFLDPVDPVDPGKTRYWHYPIEVRFRSGQAIDNDLNQDDFFVCIRTRGGDTGIHYLDDFKVTVRNITTGARLFNNRDTEAFQTAYTITCNVPTFLTDLTDKNPLDPTYVARIRPGQLFPVFALNFFDSVSAGRDASGLEQFVDGERKLKTVKVQIDQVGTDEAFSLSDLMPLQTGAKSGESGVALYWDAQNTTGSQNGTSGALDELYDVPVPIANVTVTESNQGGRKGFIIALEIDQTKPQALIPDNDSGGLSGADFFLVLRTSSTITIGDDFVVSIPPGGIEFNTGNTLKTISSRVVVADFVSIKLIDMLAGVSQVDVNSPPTPAIGINMVRPASAAVTFLGVKVWVNDASGKLEILAPLVPNNPQSGLAVWSDTDANSEGTFSVQDSVVGCTYTQEVGVKNSKGDTGTLVTITFATGQPIAADDVGTNAGFDYYLVFRTGSSVSFRNLYFEIPAGGIITSRGDTNDVPVASSAVSGKIDARLTDLTGGGMLIKKNSDPTAIIAMDFGTGMNPADTNAPKLKQITLRIIPAGGTLTPSDFEVCVKTPNPPTVESGIILYQDETTRHDGAFRSDDVPMALAAAPTIVQNPGESWFTSTIVLSSPAPLPERVDGVADFYIAVMTSKTAERGDAFRLEIRSDGIVVTTADCKANVLTGVVTVGGYTDIIPQDLVAGMVVPPDTVAYVDINSGPFGLLGLDMRRGAGGTTKLSAVQVSVSDVNALAPLSGFSTSGLSLWRDDGPNSAGRFDPKDDSAIPVTPSFDQAAGVVTLTLDTPEDIPDDDAAPNDGNDFYVAFSTSDKLSFDQQLTFAIPANGVVTSSNDTGDRFPITAVKGNLPVKLTDLVEAGQTVGPVSPPTVMVGIEAADSGQGSALQQVEIDLVPSGIVTVVNPADGGVVLRDLLFSRYAVDWTVVIQPGATAAQVTATINSLPPVQSVQTVPITGENVGVGRFTDVDGRTYDPLAVIFIDGTVVNEGDTYTFRTLPPPDPITAADFEPGLRPTVPLAPNWRSGVAIYLDNGDGVFDPTTDTPLTLAQDPTIANRPGSNVLAATLVLDPPVNIPDAFDGKADFFLAVMTSASFQTNDRFRAMVPAGGLVFTKGRANTSIVTRSVNNGVVNAVVTELLTQTVPAGSPPTALIGLNMWSAMIPSPSVRKVEVQLNGLGLVDSDIRPLAADATSGVALYLDNGTTQGVFDANDTLVPLDLQRSSLTSLKAILVPQNGIVIPSDDANANVGDDLYVVVRTSDGANVDNQVLVAKLTVTFDLTAIGQQESRVLIDRVVRITGVVPTQVSTDGGTIVTVFGSGFDAGTAPGPYIQVLVNTAALPSSEVRVAADGKSLTFAAPKQPAGAADLTIINPNKIVAVKQGALNYVAPPSGSLILYRVSPTKGPNSGTVLSVVGANIGTDIQIAIAPTGTPSVAFADYLKTVVLKTNSLVKVNTGSLAAGVYDVMGRNSATSPVVRLNGAYTVVVPQAVPITLNPKFAGKQGGTTITVTGSGFAQDSVLEVGGQKVQFTFVSATQLTFKAPPQGAIGLVQVKVTNSDWTYGSADLQYIITDLVGDANGDGVVDAKDVEAIAKDEAGSVLITDPVLRYYADVDGDGELTTLDAYYVQQIVTKKISPPSRGAPPGVTTKPKGAQASLGASSFRVVPFQGPTVQTQCTLVDLTGLTPGRLVGGGAENVQIIGLNVSDTRGGGFISFLRVRFLDYPAAQGLLNGSYFTSVALYKDSPTEGVAGKYDPADILITAGPTPGGAKGTEFSWKPSDPQLTQDPQQVAPIPMDDASAVNRGPDYFIVITLSDLIPTGTQFIAEIRTLDDTGQPLSDPDLKFTVSGAETSADLTAYNGIFQTQPMKVDNTEPTVQFTKPDDLEIVSTDETLDSRHKLITGTATDTGGGSVAYVQLCYAPAATLMGDLTARVSNVLSVDSVRHFADPATEGAYTVTVGGEQALCIAVDAGTNTITLGAPVSFKHLKGEKVYGRFTSYQLVDDESGVGDYSKWSYDLGRYITRGPQATGAWVVRARGFDTALPDNTNTAFVAERVLVVDSDPPRLVGEPVPSKGPQGVTIWGTIDATSSPQVRASSIKEILVSINGGSFIKARAAGDGIDSDGDGRINEERIYYYADAEPGTPGRFDPGIDEVFLNDGGTDGVYDGTNTVICDGDLDHPGVDTPIGTPITRIGNDYRDYYQEFETFLDDGGIGGVYDGTNTVLWEGHEPGIQTPIGTTLAVIGTDSKTGRSVLAYRKNGWCWADEPGRTANLLDVKNDGVQPAHIHVLDEMYIDTNGDGVYGPEDIPLYAGANGTFDAAIGARLNLMGNDDNDYWADAPVSGGTAGVYDPRIDEVFRNDGFTTGFYDGTNTVLYSGPARLSSKVEQRQINPGPPPTVTANPNTGDGMLSGIVVDPLALQEVWYVYCVSAPTTLDPTTVFEVYGSRSGLQLNTYAITDVASPQYETDDGKVKFTIRAGATAFVLTDGFTFGIVKDKVDILPQPPTAIQPLMDEDLAAPSSSERIVWWLPVAAVDSVDKILTISVQATDSAGNKLGLSGGGYFPVGDLRAEAQYKRVVLTWRNPTQKDFAGVLVLRHEGSAPTYTPPAGTAPANLPDVLPDGSVNVRVASSTAQTVTDQGLSNGVRYYYAVFAYYKDGSYSSAVRVSAVPDLPEVVQLSYRLYSDGVMIEWQYPPDANPDNPLQHTIKTVTVLRGVGVVPEKSDIQQPRSNVTVFSPSLSRAATSYFDATVVFDGTEYIYRLFTSDGTEYSGGSAVLRVVTSVSAPTSPEHLRIAKKGKDDFELTWTQPTILDGQLIGFRVYVRAKGSQSYTLLNSELVPAGRLSYVPTPLSAGQTYLFAVTSVVLKGKTEVESSPSVPVGLKGSKPLSTMCGIVVNRNGQRVAGAEVKMTLVKGLKSFPGAKPGTVRKTTADALGAFQVELLPPGKYNLAIRAGRRHNWWSFSVDIPVGEAMSPPQEFQLQ